MSLFRGIASTLPSKQFGEDIYYFDKKDHGIVAIQQSNGSFTYVVRTSLEPNKTCMITELPDGSHVKCQLNLKDIFIIPNIQTRSDVSLLKKSEGLFTPACLNPEVVFEVVDYGLLTRDNFRGALMSRARICVAVTNSQRNVYEICMTVGEGVKGCDGNPFGEITDAYKFTLVGADLGATKFLYI